MGTTKVTPSRRKDAPDHAQDQAAPETASAGDVRVGAADDQYEAAADRAADAAVRRLAEGGALGESVGFGTAPRVPGAVGAEGGATDAATADRIQSARGGGTPLPPSLRRSMESAFGGAGFGGVRLHTGPEAADLSAQVGAHAFTIGQDIFLGGSMPALESREGQHTLAHELAHTQQEEAGSVHRLFGWGKKSAKQDLTGYTPAAGSTPLQAEKDTTPGNETSERLETFDGASEVIKGGGSDVNDAFNAAEGYESDYTTATKIHNSAMTDAKGDTKISEAGAAFAAFGVIADGARTLKLFIDGGKPTDKAEAIIGTVASTSSVASAGAAVQKNREALADSDGNASSMTTAAAGILEEVTGAINAFKAGFKLVKDIVQIIRKADDMDDKEKVERTGVILKTALEGGKAVVDIINGIYHKAGHMTTALLHAAPGIGIAMNVMDSILNGINIGYSYVSYSEMQGHKRESKSAVQDKAVQKRATELFEAAKTNPPAQRLTMADALAKAQEEFGAQDTTFLGIKVGHRSGKAAAKYLKEKAQQRLAAATTPEEKAAAQAELDDADSYSTTRGLQGVAAKRIKRGVLNIATTLPAIAGDIATLSGVGAAIGGGLKAGSAGAKGLATLVRLGKQAIRDNFSDKLGLSKNKTTEGKAQAYDAMITSMVRHITEANAIKTTMDQIGPLGDLVKTNGVVNQIDDPTAVLKKQAAQKKAAAMVEASGMRPRKIADLRTQPKKLYGEWVDALKKR
jgi:hypothetical protein